MPIDEFGFVVHEFNSEKKMDIFINMSVDLNRAIRLRNFLTEEIERVQKPIAEMLDKVGGNVSPEI